MRLFTIGFTKTSAEHFFERLRSAGVQRLIDVRLNNISQLAGFAKRDDLKYFLRAINNADYKHIPLLAPTAEMLDAYRKQGGEWAEYERRFLDLMAQRKIEIAIQSAELEMGCLLCSEDKPHRCHRRLVAEYLRRHWQDVEIVHL
ncbi:DUF488 family protein [Sorangium cellulosum]|uniref:DUF488 domain-containing protein n=1 Tax=Sorangium cellulosum So0157-2 TaxID=1254432 RepID=S4XP58_SORCE|nr:DUF488 domain-containing protein [Sorangium cellulosum]AGP34211.1 hypothetical protein SCE1572_06690 [Sorangium cellulosum So0157-2]